MPHHCCVPQCTSDSRHNFESLSFHSFPTELNLRKKWLINIKRDPGPDFNLNIHTRVCSKHFTLDSYEISNFQRMRKRLKKTSIPSIFNWTNEPAKRRHIIKHIPSTSSSSLASSSLSLASSSSQVIIQEESSLIDQGVDQFQLDLSGNCNPLSVNSPVSFSQESDSVDSLSNISSSSSPSKDILKSQYLNILQIRSVEKFSLLRFVSSDSDIKYYTGFQSYLSLFSFYQFLLPECNFLYYTGTSNTSHGVPYDFINKRGPSRALSPLEELFITLVRLRKGLSEKLLSDLYNISEGHVSKILTTWILFLYDRLIFLPIWPSKEHVQSKLPPFFRHNFPHTRAIVDCTEFFIEQPSASLCQRETFSSYKHRNTAKGFLAISPEGQITFLSPLYAGRCSDKKIIRHCGFLDLLSDGDYLMVDRGFDIQDDLTARGVSLYIPDFLNGQKQFTGSQLENSRTVAAARVHVERAVRKVKEFEILRNIIPITICPMLEKIWFVCGHLANFTGHLIKPEKTKQIDQFNIVSQ